MNVFTIGVKLKEERKKTMPAHPREQKAFVATIGMCEPKSAK